jgi:palmitoyl-protein thioesterase
MLVKFNSDTMIHPKETAWFQQWNENGDIIVLEDTDFYKNDFVGIRYLKEHGKAKFVEIEGDHLRF